MFWILISRVPPDIPSEASITEPKKTKRIVSLWVARWKAKRRNNHSPEKKQKQFRHAFPHLPALLERTWRINCNRHTCQTRSVGVLGVSGNQSFGGRIFVTISRWFTRLIRIKSVVFVNRMLFHCWLFLCLLAGGWEQRNLNAAFLQFWFLRFAIDDKICNRRYGYARWAARCFIVSLYSTGTCTVAIHSSSSWYCMYSFHSSTSTS